MARSRATTHPPSHPEGVGLGLGLSGIVGHHIKHNGDSNRLAQDMCC